MSIVSISIKKRTCEGVEIVVYGRGLQHQGDLLVIVDSQNTLQTMRFHLIESERICFWTKPLIYCHNPTQQQLNLTQLRLDIIITPNPPPHHTNYPTYNLAEPPYNPADPPYNLAEPPYNRAEQPYNPAEPI